MVSTSVSKTESPGSNPGAPAKDFCARGLGWMVDYLNGEE